MLIIHIGKLITGQLYLGIESQQEMMEFMVGRLNTVTGPYVNVTMFEDAGVDMPEEGATWDDWADAQRSQIRTWINCRFST